MSNNGQKNKHPVLHLPRTPLDQGLEAASILGLIVMAAVLVYYWPVIPNTVPTHFGFSGEPDDWGSKTTILILPGAGFGIYLLLTAVSFFPHTYHYIWKITEQNAEAQYRLAKDLMGWLKTEIIWLFAFIVWEMIMVSLGKSGGLGRSFLPVFIVIIFGTLGVYLYRSFRAR